MISLGKGLVGMEKEVKIEQMEVREGRGREGSKSTLYTEIKLSDKKIGKLVIYLN